MLKKKNTPESRGKKWIMIVDDSKSERLFIGALFENSYEVRYMEDGQIALDHIFAGNKPDLILLDMEMPNMNGRVFLRRLKYQIAFKDIPVIFISSVNSNLIISSMLKQGIVDYLVKPFKSEELISKVNSVLGCNN
jgi:CheY-like chemotaxis protein